ncbi:2,3-dihydroxybiphenyl 1,2-dioxygenase [Bacillus sp. AFS076308]|uniref:VOC family protein n=1 Tax=unclassified Bacillus (in: firmicutes) TaxID=185979 RepID=UPI000BF5BAED|nr:MULTISPECIES: VOC family protein [unclassified Bacillus (in: firmicutes)]PFO03321.1 2,3-dihydroxybiphenyl 1,2-dioxygenase [Bacillus sp. AFS076308]PGV48589.1 2,3-dihydroxybiphenyl 1,2-dioxygenase [Bacillus sp. AFS037270]
MLPEIAKLGHIALITPNLKKSLWFFTEVLGLEETEEVNGTHYFRAWGDFEHHSLSLTQGGKSKVDHIAWRTKRPEDVGKFAEMLEAAGAKVTWVEKGVEAGQGRAIRFQLPSEHPFEIYYEMEKTKPDQERKSVLKNQVYKSWRKGASPRRFDHVNLATSQDPAVIHKWLIDNLGFKLREYVDLGNGVIQAGWLSVTPLVHDIAVMAEPEAETPNRLHHLAYWFDNAQDILRAADILSEYGIEFVGPGKHGISQAIYLYVKDPGSNHRIELFSGSYLIFEPDWEPVQWTPEDLKVGLTYWGQDAVIGNEESTEA